MRIKTLFVKVSICFAILLCIVQCCYSKSLDEEITTLSEMVTKQLIGKDGKKINIALMDALNLQGQQNELGRYLINILSTEIVMAGNISVVDRANIDRIIEENKFAKTLANPEEVKKLGKIAGIEGILVGTVDCSDTEGDLTVKVISIETAKLIAAGRCKFDMTPDLMKKFSASINGEVSMMASSRTTSGTIGAGVAGSQESAGIATKRYDTLEVVLKTVNITSLQREARSEETVPAICCSFELFNRDLRNSIVIAANGALASSSRSLYPGGGFDAINLDKYRGNISDSNGNSWHIPSGRLKGISAVLSCDISLASIHSREFIASQTNPTAVVDYIMSGKMCNMGSLHGQKDIVSGGKYWTGSFSTIPPARSIRVTVDFIPNRQQRRSFSQPRDDNKTEIPSSFQFDMELVLGTIKEGEMPEKSKDLKLQALTFDKIIMPTSKESK